MTRKSHSGSISCVCVVTQIPDFVDSSLDSPQPQEYTGHTGMRHVPLAAWGGSINRRSAGGSERVSGMEDLDLVRGPQAFWGLSHLRVSRPDPGDGPDLRSSAGSVQWRRLHAR